MYERAKKAELSFVKKVEAVLNDDEEENKEKEEKEVEDAAEEEKDEEEEAGEEGVADEEDTNNTLQFASNDHLNDLLSARGLFRRERIIISACWLDFQGNRYRQVHINFLLTYASYTPYTPYTRYT